MPWVLGLYVESQEYKDYSKIKVAELKERLVRRGLPRSGKKAALVSRLTKNDEAHPFQFMKLPPEIRNKIYTLTAATHHFGRLSSWYKPENKPYRLIGSSDQAVIVQPGLVCCSKQTRSEGLPIFFQAHHFRFIHRALKPQESTRFMAKLLLWLDKIGAVGRTNIRNLALRCSILPHHAPVMNQIHAKLSDQATVTYVINDCSEVRLFRRDVTSMLETARMSQVPDSSRVPIYEVRKVAIPYLGYSSDILIKSLKFLPGLSWFGERHPVGVQATSEEGEAATQVRE